MQYKVFLNRDQTTSEVIFTAAIWPQLSQPTSDWMSKSDDHADRAGYVLGAMARELYYKTKGDVSLVTPELIAEAFSNARDFTELPPITDATILR